jgi:geranylgeranyl diphosphate synthase, type II
MAVPLPADYEPLLRQINGWLETYQHQMETRGQVPVKLLQAMRYTLLAPGKRVRPILTLLATEACGGSLVAALPAAAAVEMIHTYSLIHDDLPAMDDDDLRRGRPTCHKAFDEATAILAGDALLTLSFQALAEEVQPGELAALCIRELSVAAGVAGMVGGQMDDILMEEQSVGTLAELRSIHQRKTGALLKCSIVMGGLIALHGQTKRSALDHLKLFADELGLAFQIADDLLDVQSDAATLGKATQKDAGHGKLTYPGLLGLDGAKQELELAYGRGLAALEPLKESGRKLAELMTYVVKRDR